IYGMVKAYATEAIRSYVWGYCATRIQAAAVSKVAQAFVGRAVSLTTHVPSIDRAFSRVTDPYAKYMTGWIVRRPSVKLTLYHDTKKQAAYFAGTGWQTKRILSAREGYKKVFGMTKRVATDKSVMEALKT
ncbi:MAG: hypothetical protein ACYC6C_07935, partial [Coriobacteriia bacterium]